MVLDRYCESGSYHAIEVDQQPDGLLIKSALGRISGRHTFPNLFVGGKSIGGSDDIVMLDKTGQLAELLPCASRPKEE